MPRFRRRSSSDIVIGKGQEIMPFGKNREWILLADKAHARIYARNGVNGRLTQVLEKEHPAARRKQSEEGAAPPGRGFKSAQPGRYAYEDHADFAEQESAEFLQGIAERLNKAVAHDKLDKLILVALPKSMAHIKSAMTDAAKEKIGEEWPKNLIGVAENSLADRLSAFKE